MANLKTAEFVKSLPVLKDFSEALPMQNYTPVPNDWFVAVTDVVKSRQAIRDGRFKQVNMAGVAVITAVMNALGHQDMPYIFGGDGAAVCCSPEDREVVETALANTVAWVNDSLDLELRAALVPVSALVEAGSSVMVSAVRVSEAIINFAFSGGGVALAEKLMKEGEFRAPRSDGESYPDLTGLSCRWTPIEEEARRIISLIIEPANGRDAIPADVMTQILHSVKGDGPDGHPLPKRGPGFKWPPAGLDLEARATGMSKPALYLITLLAWVLDKTGIPIGKFSPTRYREFTALNTDYRKIQDGIRMTVSLENELVESLRNFLNEQRSKGVLRYGMSEQDRAVLTCFVPSVTSDGHYHFLDGAGGGYAAAADDLK